MPIVPSFKTVVIGIRDPKERTVYPLSWHDLKQLQAIIGSIIAGCVNLTDSGYTQEQLYQYVLSGLCPGHRGDKALCGIPLRPPWP